MRLTSCNRVQSLSRTTYFSPLWNLASYRVPRERFSNSGAPSGGRCWYSGVRELFIWGTYLLWTKYVGKIKYIYMLVGSLLGWNILLTTYHYLPVLARNYKQHILSPTKSQKYVIDWLDLCRSVYLNLLRRTEGAKLMKHFKGVQSRNFCEPLSSTVYSAKHSHFTSPHSVPLTLLWTPSPPVTSGYLSVNTPSLYSVFHLKRNPNYFSWSRPSTKTKIPDVTADAPFQNGTAAISTVLSVDELSSQTNTSWVPKCYCRLNRWLLVRKLIAKCFTGSSERFRCTVMLIMNAPSAREKTMFGHEQFLRNWRQQRPSNQGEIDSSIRLEVVIIYYTGWSYFILLQQCWVLLGPVFSGTPCIYMKGKEEMSNFKSSELPLTAFCRHPVHLKLESYNTFRI
jgi:hypothetical protein